MNYIKPMFVKTFLEKYMSFHVKYLKIKSGIISF